MGAATLAHASLRLLGENRSQMLGRVRAHWTGASTLKDALKEIAEAHAEVYCLAVAEHAMLDSLRLAGISFVGRACGGLDSCALSALADAMSHNPDYRLDGNPRSFGVIGHPKDLPGTAQALWAAETIEAVVAKQKPRASTGLAALTGAPRATLALDTDHESGLIELALSGHFNHQRLVRMEDGDKNHRAGLFDTGDAEQAYAVLGDQLAANAIARAVAAAKAAAAG